jgi:putative MFS transporter
LVGASALGSLSDYFGRKTMFVFETMLFTLFLVMIVFAQNLVWLVMCLFGLGLALGCDYPTAHMMISESTPSRSRGGLVLGAFGFQAAGALAGTAVGYLVLSLDPTIGSWRWMYASAILPAILWPLGASTSPRARNAWSHPMASGRRAGTEALVEEGAALSL